MRNAWQWHGAHRASGPGCGATTGRGKRRGLHRLAFQMQPSHDGCPMTNSLRFEPQAEPTERDAAVIASEVFGAAVEAVVRFPTGSGHYVYDVQCAGDRRAVVRISGHDHIEEARGSIYWSRL